MQNEYTILCGACQILDVVKAEWGESWSEWDQSIRNGLSELLTRYATNVDSQSSVVGTDGENMSTPKAAPEFD